MCECVYVYVCICGVFVYVSVCVCVCMCMWCVSSEREGTVILHAGVRLYTIIEALDHSAFLKYFVPSK